MEPENKVDRLPEPTAEESEPATKEEEHAK